jgi:hypothetical protein
MADLNTSKVIAGNVVSATKDAGAGTYVTGQVLGMNSTTNVYGQYDSGATNGLENIRAVVASDRTLAGAGKVLVFISGTEVKGSQLLDSNTDPLAIDAAVIENAQNQNIIIKK